MSKNIHFLSYFTLLFAGLFCTAEIQAQCENPSVALPDTSVPIDGDLDNAYCVTITFDPSVTGYPTGLSLDIEHTWQGDLALWVEVGGVYLNIFQRPGVLNSCAGGCPCGNSADLGSPGSPSTYIFEDGGGSDPEDGMALGGGTYGITTDDGCGLGTPGVTSFADLWALFPPSGDITTNICISDHAGADSGFASNITYLFPNPVDCGCTDPDAINYDPDAEVDDDSCFYDCPDFNMTINEDMYEFCAGDHSFTMTATAPGASDATYEWTATNGGDSYLSDPFDLSTNVNIPPDFVGDIIYTITVTDEFGCTDFLEVEVIVGEGPEVEITGDDFVCEDGTTTLELVGGPFDAIEWSNGFTTDNINVGPGSYSVTVSDPAGCESVADFLVEAFPSPTPEIFGPDEICDGAEGVLELTETYAEYEWSNGDDTPTTIVTESGGYEVTVTDDNGCQGFANFTLEVSDPVVVEIMGDLQICGDGGQTLLDAGPGFVTYEWSTGETFQDIIVDFPDIVDVTVTDDLGCEGTDEVEITLFDEPEAEISGPETICIGETIELMVTEVFSSYEWSNSFTTRTTEIDAAGIYMVTVTDNNGCQAVAEFEVLEGLAVDAEVMGDLFFCQGGSTDLTITPGYDSYEWSNSLSGNEQTIDLPDSYMVTVTSTDGCTQVLNFEVVEFSSPAPAIDGDAFICEGESTTLVAGDFATYDWSTDDTSFEITVSETGTYILTVTDDNDCEGITSFNVLVNPLPEAEITGPEALCAGENTMLTVTETFSAYSWSNSFTTQSVAVDASGEYTVTVTDNNGCMDDALFEIIEGEPVIATVEGDLSFCADANTVLTITPGYISYQWSNSLSGNQQTITTPGPYMVTVTSADGCMGVVEFEVEEFEELEPTILGDEAICAGEASNLTVDDSYASYIWSTTSTDPGISATTSGTYSVTVTDVNGCEGVASFDVTVNTPAAIAITGDDEICDDGDGQLTATAGFVTYDWNTSAGTPTITVVDPGTYTVQGTDANGCTSIAQFEVAEIASPEPTISGDLTVCPGSTTVLTTEDGFNSYDWTVSGSSNEVSGVMPSTVTVVVTNATGCTGEATVEVVEVPNPMPTIIGDLVLCEEESSILSLTETYVSYQWSDSTTDPTIDVEEGTFGVTVTDAEGCIGSTSATLEEVIPTVVISGDSDFCIGETTTLTVPDNFSVYAWSTGDTGSSITTTPGTTDVMVTVTDVNGCTATDVLALTEFPLPEVEITGRLSFCPVGGTELVATEGYVNYAWSNTESTSTISTNIEGNYAVTVTDSNGCQNSTSVDIIEDSELDPEINGEPDFCAGLSTTLTVPDDFSTYMWSHGPMTNEVIFTEPGTYTVTVADEFGCMGTETIAVTQFDLPTPSIGGTLDYCIGDSTTLNGGNGYVSYAWSGGNDTQFLNVDNPGNYSLTVTDDNGCIGSTSTAVVENALPVTTILGEPGFCPGLTTILTAEDGFIAYQWSTNTSGTSIEVGTAEDFSLSVTDTNGCVGVATQLVEEYATTVPDINGAPQFCPGESTMLTGGIGFESYNWSNGSTETSVTIDQIVNISLDVTDANGCITSNSLDLTNFNVTAPIIDAPDGFCAGNTADLIATPGYATYNWSNSAETSTITVNNGGVFELDVIDTNGCPSSAAINVDQYALPTPAIGGSLTFCIGNSTQLNAGATYTTYEWSTGSDQAEVTVSNPGDVGLTVTDNNGCVGNTTEFVNEATELSPVISGDLDYCFGLTTTLSAGNGFTTYDWSTGETTSTIVVDEPGTYTLNVTDNGGCAGTAEVEVIENALPLPQIMGDLDYCAGLSTELMATPGFVSYDWNTTAPTTSIIVDEPGAYSVTVVDDNGCINETSTTVIEQALPVFDIVGPTDFCVDSFTVLNVQPAFAAYDWSVGSNDQQVEVSMGGTVGVTVTDDNGCISSSAQAVATVALPLADAGSPQDLDCDILEVNIGGNGSTTGGEFSYQWSGPGITPANANDAMPTVDEEGIYTLQILNETYGCLSEAAEVEITDLSYVPQIVLEVLDILDCATSTVQIDARDSDDGAQYVYQWYDGDLNPIPGSNTLLLSVNEAQFYTLEIIDTLTGCNTTDMIEVTENELYPIAEAGLVQLITCGDPIVTLDGTGSQIGGQITYEWTTPDGNIVGSNDDNTAMSNQSGWYYLLVTDTQNGCFNIDSVFVNQDTEIPIAQTSEDFELDCIFPTTSINGTGSSVGNNFSYQWLLNGSAVTDATNLLLTAEAPGTYTLVVTDIDNECTAQDQLEITLNPAAPQALNFATDTPTCAGDDDGAIFIGGVEGGTPPYMYSIGGAPYATTTNYGNLIAGNYDVVIEDATGCLLLTTVTVPDGNDLFLDLGEDQYLKEGELANIYPESGVDSSGLVRIDWLTVANLPCPGCYYQLDLALDNSTQFFLSIQDENGCTAEDNVTIFIDKDRNVYVPNAFSPDGQGDNNIFYIFSDDSVEKVRTFQVFNRWGESVFEVYNSPTNDPTYGWDGLHRGQAVNSAVYVWFAEIEFKNGDVVVFEGDVVIMK